MAVAKMSLINVVGHRLFLEQTLLGFCQSGVSHPEDSKALIGKNEKITSLEVDNPFSTSLAKITDLIISSNIIPQYKDCSNLNMDFDEIANFIKEFNKKHNNLKSEIAKIENEIAQHKQAYIQINHTVGFNGNFDELFACKYTKVRFGKLPVDSYPKLQAYDDVEFEFLVFDKDKDYYWGVYVMPKLGSTKVDEIFNMLYFERMWVPDYAHGTPTDTLNKLSEELVKEKELLKISEDELTDLIQKSKDVLLQIYSKLKFNFEVFSFRKFVSVTPHGFYIVGFVPENETNKFLDFFKDIDGVDCIVEAGDGNEKLITPVLLKNSDFAKPFETFIDMYGLPSYKDIDPTPIVAVIYSILFGIMFADLGQGFVIGLLGFLAWKIKKMPLGQILIRCGISSMIFGTIFGSVFGFEDLLNPLFRLIGFESKPFEIMNASSINVILISSVALGVLIIIFAMCLNIVLGLRNKNYTKAIFGPNGLAGLTVMSGMGLGGGFLVLAGINIFNPIFFTFVLIIPFISILFAHPLGNLVLKKKMFHESIGSYIIESSFELFEIVIAYFSNSISFVRIGVFVLSHVGMMTVVFTLADISGKIANPFVIVLGNIFVIAMEGLIVGIQVLRLNFYEIFSRFFEGSGKPYEPFVVKYDNK